jgi:acyl-coenzyme A synthetase/AMP-(fatty) acid ligase
VAVGSPSAGTGGEALLLLAEVVRGGRTDDEALAGRVAGAVLERTGVRPTEVRLLAPGTLPRTSSGKLRRQEALRRLLVGELSAPPEAGALRLAAWAARSQLAMVTAWWRRGAL